jgi:hypothetical protein
MHFAIDLEKMSKQTALRVSVETEMGATDLIVRSQLISE